MAVIMDPESRLWLDLDHCPVVFFRQDVNQSVRPLADVPHALMERLQHRFPALLPQLVVEDDSFQVASTWNSSALDAQARTRRLNRIADIQILNIGKPAPLVPRLST